MKITEHADNGNNLSEVTYNNNFSGFSSFLDSGNIVPTIWYHKLLRPCGKSDCSAISILSELVFLHRSSGNTEFQLNFKYFKNKFNFGLSQAKAAIIRLEQQGLVTRNPKTIIILGRAFANEMFLVLNIDKVLELNKETINEDLEEKFQSGSGNDGYNDCKSKDNKSNNPKPKCEFEASKSNESIFLKIFNQITDTDSLESIEPTKKETGFYLSHAPIYRETVRQQAMERQVSEAQANKATECRQSEILNKGIDTANETATTATAGIESVVELSTKLAATIPDPTLAAAQPQLQEDLPNNEPSVPLIASSLQSNKPVTAPFWSRLNFFGKKLAEFYPLNPEDRDLLAVKSGRDFDLNFINQLLLKISNKYPDHKFYNKSAMLNYVAKLLSYELRDATQVSNGCFRFKSDDQNLRSTNNIERYLQKIESSFDTSNIMQLKRKIAGIFASDIAYLLLYNTEFSLNKNEFTIKVKSHTKPNLSSYQHGVLLEQVRSIYGNNITSINIVAEDKALLQSEVQLQPSSANKLTQNQTSDSNISTSSSGESKEDLSHINNAHNESSIWCKVRLALIGHFREGEILDRIWFSKLEAIYDHDRQKLTLKAPNSFVRDWVWQHYGYLIERYCMSENYQLVELR